MAHFTTPVTEDTSSNSLPSSATFSASENIHTTDPGVVQSSGATPTTQSSCSALVESVQTRPQHYNIEISESLRELVWRRCWRRARGTCPVCSVEITDQNFKEGYIIAPCNGGAVVPHNLLPVCKTCYHCMKGYDMGIYMREFYGISATYSIAKYCRG